MNSFKTKYNLSKISKINSCFINKPFKSINSKINLNDSSINLNNNKINQLSTEKIKNMEKKSNYCNLALNKIEKDKKNTKNGKSIKLIRNSKVIHKGPLTDSSVPLKESKSNLNQRNESNISKINGEIKFTQKIKFNSPVCKKCFRFTYISFNFIKNYISKICPYCRDISIYTYENFLEKIKQNNNPLLNSFCKKCNNSFIFSQYSNPFYLIEKENKKFFIMCKQCLELDKVKEYQKKIKCNELLEHFDKFYKNGEEEKSIYKLELLKTADEKSDKDIDKDIEKYLKHFGIYKNNILIIEDILKNYILPLSLKQKVENKLSNLIKDIKIKNKIVEYYNEIKNSITRENIISMLHNIIDFSNFELLESIGVSSFKQIKELISEKKINKKIIIKL